MRGKARKESGGDGEEKPWESRFLQVGFAGLWSFTENALSFCLKYGQDTLHAHIPQPCKIPEEALVLVNHPQHCRQLFTLSLYYNPHSPQETRVPAYSHP